MGFLEEYKRLEKLCGDIMNDDRRVSAYIEEMLNTPRGRYRVRGWDEDLKQLKHCRWVRNQIVHNPDCKEENMCDAHDIQWIVEFRMRIMHQTDPLAEYRKATQPAPVPVAKKTGMQFSREYSQSGYNHFEPQEERNDRGVLKFAGVVAVLLAMCVLFTLLSRV